MSYILRRVGLGRSSVRGIILNSETGIEGYLNDGRKHNPEGGYIKENLPQNPDIVFRWGCASTIPGNPLVINKAKYIHLVSDKAGFRKMCADHGLSMDTWLSYSEFFDSESGVEGRYVVRPPKHSQGKKLTVCSSMAAVEAACNKYGEYYISKLIDKIAEYRVFVAEGRVVWVARKIPGNPDQVAWNVAQGGVFENVKWDSWPLKMLSMAIEAHNLSGIDFSGVDIMVDADDRAYVLEINSAPSQTSPYRQSCVAKVFDSIVEAGRATNYPHNIGEGWRGLIHPAIWSKGK